MPELFLDKLPPPYLPQMSDDGAITSNETQYDDDSIVVDIRKYPSFEPGDYIRCYFNGGLLGGKQIDSVDLFPFVLKYKNASLLEPGYYPVYYIVTDINQNPSASPVVYAFFTPYGNVPYPPPIFTDAVDGFLPSDAYTNGVNVDVLYPYLRQGDNFDVVLSGVSQGGGGAGRESINHTVTADDVLNSQDGHPVRVTFTNNIPVSDLQGKGSLNAYYAGRLAGNPDMTSGTRTVRLDKNTPIFLPGPTFPDAENGVLTLYPTSTGTPLRASYTPIRTNDVVTFRVRGVSQQGNDIAEAIWSESVTITAAVAATGSVTVPIPASVLTAVGNQGRIIARYSLLSVNEFQGNSPESEVLIDINTSTVIIPGIQISTNSPFRDNNRSFNPCNRGVVYAPPGSAVELRAFPLTDGAQPLLTLVNKTGESIGNPGDVIYIRTDTSGRADFTAHVDNAYGLCMVRATIEDVLIGGGSRTIVDKNIEFSRYFQGNSFINYRSTTEAPADGIVRNTVYVIASQSARSDVISVEITGSPTARLAGASWPGPDGQTGTYVLNADKSVAIDVTDTVANNPNLEIRLNLPFDNGSQLTVTGINGMIFSTPLNV